MPKTEMYAEFAKVAKEEGFDYIAMLFEEVGKIEKEHEERYNALVANIENDRVFKREEKQVWICGNCGHIVIAEKAPEVCPVCDHPKSPVGKSCRGFLYSFKNLTCKVFFIML